MNEDACKTVVVRGVMICFVQTGKHAASWGWEVEGRNKITPKKLPTLGSVKDVSFPLIDLKIISRWYGLKTDVRTNEVGQRSLPALLELQ